MTELLTAAQMRAIEQAAIDAGDVTGLELMERAGQGVVAAIFEEWPELAPAASDARGAAPAPPEFLRTDEKGRRAVILCGPGNNGGDGFVVARLLRGLGWDVQVFLYGDARKLPPDALVNYEKWRELGTVHSLGRNEEPFKEAFAYLGDGDLIVDALFGIGLNRPFEDLPSSQMALNDTGHFSEDELGYPRAVAIDLPSGFDGDSGRFLSNDKTDERNFFAFAPRANLTVTFHERKVGHFVGVAHEACGKLVVVDIGLGSTFESQNEDEGALSGKKAIQLDCLTVNASSILKRHGHKFSHGHALILSGHMGKGGAARLAARGALRIGAGVVSVGCPPSALLEHATQLTAIMTRKIADAEALTSALDDDRINALCVGPGLGLGEREAALVDAAIPKDQSKRSVVFDADALTLISQSADLFAKLNNNCVLTPHAGEFARLFPDIAERLNGPATTGPAYSKVDASKDAAKRAGCVVLFKGPDTVIAHPDGRCSINAALYERSAPWLATAGSGDVLAGFIAGLLARGFSPMRAAESGAWLHVECARSFGPGLIAEDLPEELPKVFRNLGL